jgi:hypothetical protein
MMKKPGRIPLELIFWTTALAALATATPYDHLHHHDFTLCPLSNLGLKWCPGCGMGRAITNILHGNLQESLKLHWFGIPALLIICVRIVALVKLQSKYLFKTNDYV